MEKKILMIFIAFCLGGATLGVGIGVGTSVVSHFISANENTADGANAAESTITSVRVNPLVVPIDTQEPSFVEIIPDAQASVVSINVTAPSGRSGGRSEIPGSGSGFLFAEDDEFIFIATNNHVIENTTSITVSLDDIINITAEIVGFDRASDVAVLAVSRVELEATESRYTIARFGDSDTLRPGDSVIAIGNAMGDGQTVTRGIISALSLNIEIPDLHNRLSLGVLQTDAAVNRGNSGGPLINQNGEVVGIVTAKLIGTDIEGMGYVLPINNVRELLMDIMETGTVRRTYLGISTEEINENFRGLFNLPSTGVLIGDVQTGSPADEAGLIRRDLIVKFNERPIANNADLQAALESARAGDAVTLGIYRDGVLIEISVVLSSRLP